VQTPAIRKARSRWARIIGIRRTSGGIGKTELSMKEMVARIASACGLAACSMVQS
jgi:hypothetical protein